MPDTNESRNCRLNRIEIGLAAICIALTAIVILLSERNASGLLLFVSLSFLIVILFAIVANSHEITGPTERSSQDSNSDIDSLDDLKNRLAECERLVNLGQLAAGVAHELNNPLGGILVYSHLLKEDTDEDDPRQANIDKIIRESNRCKRIIKSLLDYSRQSEPFLQETDINAVLTDALDNIKRDRCFGMVDVRLALADDLPMVKADASQVQEVFENIIRNAAEVILGEGYISIETAMDNDASGGPWLAITVADSGPGIPEEHMAHIFDPFYTTKLKGHGTGLGLAVCHGIIERHHGRIDVANRPEGGAVFTIRLNAGDTA